MMDFATVEKGNAMADGKRLIDADRALEIVRDQGIAHPNAYHLTNYATLILREAPTVDAVEVLRCRDCKYWGDEDDKLQDSDGVLFARCKVHNYLIDGRHTGWCPTENDFCSYGERKEGAH